MVFVLLNGCAASDTAPFANTASCRAVRNGEGGPISTIVNAALCIPTTALVTPVEAMVGHRDIDSHATRLQTLPPTRFRQFSPEKMAPPRAPLQSNDWPSAPSSMAAPPTSALQPDIAVEPTSPPAPVTPTPHSALSGNESGDSQKKGAFGAPTAEELIGRTR